jgi:glycosyltransferase involved in cell wall biosynthesis
MRIFVLKPNEDWCVDRFVDEWYANNPTISTKNPYEADIIWLMASWCYDQLPYDFLKSKKVVSTLHHIVPGKFYPKINERLNFLKLSNITDAWHVPCKNSNIQLQEAINSISNIQPQSDKPVLEQPFWVNQGIWYEIDEGRSVNKLREKLNLPVNKRLIGSFQRDTEGSDLITPKYEKGPDIFCDYVIEARDIDREMQKDNNVEIIDLEVVLAGYERQYIINRLNKAGIKYHYFETTTFQQLNELYNAIDLYVVASRWEGGPLSIVECAATRCPIISTNVGLAPEILSSNSISKLKIDNIDGKSMANENLQIYSDVSYENVKNYFMPIGFRNFIRFFESVMDSNSVI